MIIKAAHRFKKPVRRNNMDVLTNLIAIAAIMAAAGYKIDYIRARVSSKDKAEFERRLKIRTDAGNGK